MHSLPDNAVQCLCVVSCNAAMKTTQKTVSYHDLQQTQQVAYWMTCSRGRLQDKYINTTPQPFNVPDFREGLLLLTCRMTYRIGAYIAVQKTMTPT